MRWEGPFQSPNLTGMELAILAVIVLMAIEWTNRITGRRPKVISRIAGAMFLCSCLVGLVATGSRAASLAFAITAIAQTVLGLTTWRTSVLAIALLAIITYFSSSFERYISPQNDPSISHRVQLWQCTLALIADHPLRGVGFSNLTKFLDQWYLPQGLYGRFATSLNDPLTAIASWGIPVFIGLSFGAICIVYMGVRSCLSGGRWAAIGISIVLVQMVCGQFQAHSFSGRWCVGAQWIISDLIIISGYLHINRRFLLACGISSMAIGASILSAATILGHAECATLIVGEDIIGLPRHTQAKGLIILVPSKEMPQSERLNWRDDRLRNNYSLVILGQVPDQEKVMVLESAASMIDQNTVIVASGDIAVGLWGDWRKGMIRASVRLCDPSTAPTGGTCSPGRNALEVILARSAPFVDKVGIYERLKSDSCNAPILVTGTDASRSKFSPFLSAAGQPPMSAP